ncbi:MAG: META domain-containing protein [Desulfobulbaceae bacterium]|nr:META domain-containing protein [Desulfobulbaceae bacterium]
MIRLLVLLNLVLVAISCTPAASTEMISPRHDPAKVLGRTWLWEATVTPVERIVVAHPELYTINLGDNGRLQAQFDCNRGGGTYTLSAGQISFGSLISTRKACPEYSQDAAFMRDLQRVQSFFLQDGQLFLELPMDSGTMRFSENP